MLVFKEVANCVLHKSENMVQRSFYQNLIVDVYCFVWSLEMFQVQLVHGDNLQLD